MVLICLFDLWGELGPGIYNFEATPPQKNKNRRGGPFYFCGPNIILTYLPHKAVAEVSKDKEPIGRGRVEFKWFESQLMSDSSALWLSIDLGFK